MVCKKRTELETIDIVQGDTSSILTVQREDELDYSLFSGSVSIRNLNSNLEVLRRDDVEVDLENGLLFVLYPDDTANLEPGEYNLAYEIRKTDASVVTFQRELHYILCVLPGMIN